MSLQEELIAVIRRKHSSIRTECSSWQWITAFLRFHRSRGSNGRMQWGHPSQMGAAEIAAYLTHLLEDGYDIRTIQTLLGHAQVETIMIYTHVVERSTRGVLRVRSPLEARAPRTRTDGTHSRDSMLTSAMLRDLV
jgi:integrase